MVYGPGLPQGGVRYARPDLGGWWSIDGKSSNFYVMGNSCGGIQAASDSIISGDPGRRNVHRRGLRRRREPRELPGRESTIRARSRTELIR